MDWAPALLLTPFLSLFFCALAALISLRCDTVRGAAQWTGLLLLLLFPVVAFAAHSLLGNWRGSALMVAALAGGSLLCFALALRRFRRAV
jgi:hypothetical protein